MFRQWIVGATFVLLLGAVGFAQQPTQADQIKSRQRISMMEGVLERAVSNGAETMVRQMKAAMGDAPMLTGMPEARGFNLDGYGIFFDVEVPALRLPVTWPLRNMFRDSRETTRAIDELRAMMADAEPRQRDRLALIVRQLEQGQGTSGMRGAGRLGAAMPLQVAGAAPVDTSAFENPEELYTRAIKAALVEAMLEYSGSIPVGADEWLSVAARDNVPRDPLIPTDTADTTSVIFRVKGSDLSAFRAGRMTLDEVRKKVETREY
jgi:hypothetical protein